MLACVHLAATGVVGVSVVMVMMTVTAPVFAQEPGPDAMAVNASPVHIETLEIEPTVAKTGDLIETLTEFGSVLPETF